MKPEDREQLLWQLTEIEDSSPQEDSLINEDLLLAYRNGELSGAPAREVERLLRANPRNRHRLQELAGLEDVAEAHRLRSRVLTAALPAQSPPVPIRSWWQRPGSRRVVIAIAALLAIALAARLLVPQKSTLPNYRVEVSALKTHRSSAGDAPAISNRAMAYPETMVTITGAATDRATSASEAGLYHLRDAQLLRLDAEGSDSVKNLEIEILQGGITFAAPAGALTEQIGIHQFFLVIAWQGDLPSSLSIQPGEYALSKLEAGDRRRAYPLLLEIKAHPQPSQATEGSTQDPS